jgi:hypothetical protein
MGDSESWAVVSLVWLPSLMVNKEQIEVIGSTTARHELEVFPLLGARRGRSACSRPHIGLIHSS